MKEKEKNEHNISKSVIGRLPRYYRFLGMLINEGHERISSSELSKRLGLTASQIRQDFNHFGGFGQQGYGYNVKQLQQNIGHIIGIDNYYGIVLVGAGNLGRAIAQHLDFKKKALSLSVFLILMRNSQGWILTILQCVHSMTLAVFVKKLNRKQQFCAFPNTQEKLLPKSLLNAE